MEQVLEVGALRTVEVKAAATRSVAGSGEAETGSLAALAEYRYRPFTAGAVTLATLLGTPVAGATLIALNYKLRGRTGAAVMVLLAGAMATAVAVMAGYLFPGAAFSPIGLGALLLTRAGAIALQGKAIERHVKAGGKTASGWAALGIGLAFLVAIAVAVLMVMATLGVRR